MRREQYFHRNTLLNGSGFDYHGNPISILKGRVIAVAIFVMLWFIEKTDVHLPVELLLFPLIPWFMIRSLAFRARNTSFRGVHFDFRGTYMRLLKIFIGYLAASAALFAVASLVCIVAVFSVFSIETFSILVQNFSILVLITLTSAYAFMAVTLIMAVSLIFIPAWARSTKLFQFNHLAFGASVFRTQCNNRSFYLIYLKALLAIPLYAVAIKIFTELPIPYYLFDILVVLIFLVVFVYLQAQTANLLWNNTRLGRLGFISDLRFFELIRINISNWLLMVITLGLYWPWAKVKLFAYRMEYTAIFTRDSLDDFIAGACPKKGAISEEITNIFNFDISL